MEDAPGDRQVGGIEGCRLHLDKGLVGGWMRLGDIDERGGRLPDLDYDCAFISRPAERR